MKKIRVLVGDDSALVLKILTTALSMTDDIEVVATATDPYMARDKIKKLCPDVLTLDVEMPKMDGIRFLRNLMRLRPMPVVMISTLTSKGSDVALNALELGAVDFIAKPDARLDGNIIEFATEVQDKVRAAASARVQPLQKKVAVATPTTTPASSSAKRGSSVFGRMIAIGASTGGTEAIKTVLMDLPADCPPIVITQHIPAQFSASYARRLDDTCAMNVSEAIHNGPILSGHAYIAPGDKHLQIVKTYGKFFCKLSSSELVNRHRPAVDVLFDSVIAHADKSTIGVLLTGMGADGAQGMLRLHEHGFYTIAQDESSAVVWGMPGAAVKLGAVDEVLPLSKIAARLLQLPKAGRSRKAVRR
jgi:two-component system chemotaxis response regulator CheB